MTKMINALPAIREIAYITHYRRNVCQLTTICMNRLNISPLDNTLVGIVGNPSAKNNLDAIQSWIVHETDNGQNNGIGNVSEKLYLKLKRRLLEASNNSLWD